MLIIKKIVPQQKAKLLKENPYKPEERKCSLCAKPTIYYDLCHDHMEKTNDYITYKQLEDKYLNIYNASSLFVREKYLSKKSIGYLKIIVNKINHCLYLRQRDSDEKFGGMDEGHKYYYDNLCSLKEDLERYINNNSEWIYIDPKMDYIFD